MVCSPPLTRHPLPLGPFPPQLNRVHMNEAVSTHACTFSSPGNTRARLLHSLLFRSDKVLLRREREFHPLTFIWWLGR